MEVLSKMVSRFLKLIFTLPIYLYRGTISPFGISKCRFDPSCSQYALDAIKTWGAMRGTYLAIRRILRCHPLGGHGYDPVPPNPKKLY